MSYDGLAARMTELGCAINGSALYKIEKGTPPRRITVDELVALAQIFETSMEDLLLPPELVAEKRLTQLLRDWEATRARERSAAEETREAWEALKRYVHENADLEERLAEEFAGWAEQQHDDESQRRSLVAFHMWQATGSQDWMLKVLGIDPAAVPSGEGETDGEHPEAP